jgi:hypothetical protein
VMKCEQDALIRFGVYEVNPRSGELKRRGSFVKPQDQPFRVLLAMLERQKTTGQVSGRCQQVEEMKFE